MSPAANSPVPSSSVQLSFVDLHSHVLPGVDDGASSLEEAVAMLRLAHATGTRRIVATPHLFTAAFASNTAAFLVEQFDGFREELATLQPRPEHEFLNSLQLDLAAEHHVSPEFFTALAAGEVLPYGNTRRLLVELPIFMPPEGVEAAMERVCQEGYQPLIAHVERYGLLVERRRCLRRLLDRGCLLQINGASFLSASPRVRRVCHGLLQRGWVHAVASDGHHLDRRPPVLDGVADLLQKRHGAPQTRLALHDGPQRILDGAELPTPARGLRDWLETFGRG